VRFLNRLPGTIRWVVAALLQENIDITQEIASQRQEMRVLLLNTCSRHNIGNPRWHTIITPVCVRIVTCVVNPLTKFYSCEGVDFMCFKTASR
jgi:hypothetical protein